MPKPPDNTHPALPPNALDTSPGVTPETLARMRPDLEQAAEYARTSRSDNTRRAYQASWRAFEVWCRRMQLDPMRAPEAAVAAFIAGEAKRFKLSTVEMRVSAISAAYREAGLFPPTKSMAVSRVMEGIRREKGVRVVKKKPMTVELLSRCVDRLPRTSAGLRDRALLLLGFAAALRRSELVGVDLEHLEEAPEGFILTVPRRKTDQKGEGTLIGVLRAKRLCPIRAVQQWQQHAGLLVGPLFRPFDRDGRLLRHERLDAGAVALIVKRAVERTGTDPTPYAGHSLRSGLVSEAAAQGLLSRDIMAQTGHKDERMLAEYMHRAHLFENNASSILP